MYAFNAIVGIAVAPPPAAPTGHDPNHTALALMIIAAVMTTAVVVETIRHHRGRRVHHPIPISARHAGRGSDPSERKHRETSKPPVLLAHRP
ncbi:MAG: hypothetical protein ACRD0P_06395 [Stackebrandtia sp.]